MNSKQLERLNDNYFSKYNPCPLKLRCGEEILVYPTLVEDGDDYYKCINLFNFEKDKIVINAGTAHGSNKITPNRRLNLING